MVFFYQAFDMTRGATKIYTIPEGEKKIADHAFCGCVGLEKIIIPSHVQDLGYNVFDGCVNTQILFKSTTNMFFYGDNSFKGTNFKYIYLSKDGEDILLSPYKDESLKDDYICSDFNMDKLVKYFSCKGNYRKNFVQTYLWKKEGKIKFIPPDFTLQVFPASQLKNYFINNNNKRWAMLVKEFGSDTLTEYEKNNSFSELMKIYYALGGFSENTAEREKAYDYVLNYVPYKRSADNTPFIVCDDIHSKFSKIELKGAYNPTFSKFFMKYYHKNPMFMYFSVNESAYYKRDYICEAHNSFDRILKSFPNRVVYGNEERALLSPEFVAEHCLMVEYNSVDKGNETLAEIVGRYGYSQDQFNQIQYVYNEAKRIKSNYVICADKAIEKNGISFRILEKDDPLGFVLGDITNCCQHIGGVAEKCVFDGYKNKNAGFLVFEESYYDENGDPAKEKRILGQAYIWYDPETKTVCYDNIEIPTAVLKDLKKGEKHNDKFSTNSFLDAIVDSADAIMKAMNNRGVKVERVTTGKGYNDLAEQLQKRFGRPEENPKARHRGYYGYTDADKAQFVIRTYDEVTKNYSDTIRETAKIIREDLNELDASQNDFEM